MTPKRPRGSSIPSKRASTAVDPSVITPSKKNAKTNHPLQSTLLPADMGIPEPTVDHGITPPDLQPDILVTELSTSIEQTSSLGDPVVASVSDRSNEIIPPIDASAHNSLPHAVELKNLLDLTDTDLELAIGEVIREPGFEELVSGLLVSMTLLKNKLIIYYR